MNRKARHLRLQVLAFVSALGLAACSQVDASKDANQNDISFADTQAAARSGDATAQYNLAQMYHDGLGVAQDQSEAVKWYQKSADQGLVSAQYNLAYSYAHGDGVQQDLDEARKWYLKAADQGDASAQHNIAVMFALGQGVAQDYGEAAKWFRKAADQGHAKSQFKLAILYAKGDGVPQDYVQAHKWFALAGANTSDAQIKQQSAEFRVEVAEKMTSSQLAEANELAKAWKPAER